MASAGAWEPFSDSSVMVAVRVRPFNKREKEMGATEVVQVTGEQSVHMTDDPTTKQDDVRDFGYDQVLPLVASQKEMYDRSAEHVVDRVLEGYNACVFAYGQTGSGKTYSMMGPEGTATEASEGIIPRMCRDILGRLEALKAKKCNGTVEAS
jgi:hypothetical protein